MWRLTFLTRTHLEVTFYYFRNTKAHSSTVSDLGLFKLCVTLWRANLKPPYSMEKRAILQAFFTEFFSVVLCVTSVFVLVLGGLCSVLFILLKYGFYERMLKQLIVIMALCPIIFALDYEIVDHYWEMNNTYSTWSNNKNSWCPTTQSCETKPDPTLCTLMTLTLNVFIHWACRGVFWIKLSFSNFFVMSVVLCLPHIKGWVCPRTEPHCWYILYIATEQQGNTNFLKDKPVEEEIEARYIESSVSITYELQIIKTFRMIFLFKMNINRGDWKHACWQCKTRLTLFMTVMWWCCEVQHQQVMLIHTLWRCVWAYVAISFKITAARLLSFTHSHFLPFSPSHSLTHSTLNYAALDHQGFTYNTLSSPRHSLSITRTHWHYLIITYHATHTNHTHLSASHHLEWCKVGWSCDISFIKAAANYRGLRDNRGNNNMRKCGRELFGDSETAVFYTKCQLMSAQT